MELENRELCRKCGGTCCKETGCYYSADDFKVINSRSIKDLLNEGYTSIGSDILYSYPYKVILLLKARNRDAEKIDLISCSSYCSALEDTGCRYTLDERPSGGKYLIPKKRKMCCYEDIRLIDIILSWLPYQDMLMELCEELTGSPYKELMSAQVEEYFYYIKTHYVPDSVKASKDLYQLAFPNEEHKALKRVYGLKDGDTLRTKILKIF